MTITEKKQDLFCNTDDYYYAHCISGDFALGAGIAVSFNTRYDMRKKLKEKYGFMSSNGAILVENVFNLVTKEKYWHKPTYLSLREALEVMKCCVNQLNIKKIAMPKIGCGLDKLDWAKTKAVIEDVFKDSDVEILVCYL